MGRQDTEKVGFTITKENHFFVIKNGSSRGASGDVGVADLVDQNRADPFL
jgi:hypothetical protein